MDPVSGTPAANSQEGGGLTAEQQSAINQGVAQMSAGFLLLMHGEQKKQLNETINDMNK